MFDKELSCKDCPDRRILPRCHTDCKGYKNRCKKQQELRKERLNLMYYNEYVYSRMYKHSRRY